MALSLGWNHCRERKMLIYNQVQPLESRVNISVPLTGSSGTFERFCQQPVWTVKEKTWIKMAANLSKNGAVLMAAYKEVVDGKSDTDW